MTAREDGHRGGNRTKERDGRDHFERIAKKGDTAVAACHSHEHFKAKGRNGEHKTTELVKLGKRAVEEAREQS